MELIPLIGVCIGMVQILRKSLDTPNRIAWWDKVLAKVAVGSLIFYGLVQVPWLHFVGDWYGKIMYVILLLTVWFLRDYKAARLVAVALLPLAGIHIVSTISEWILPPAVYDEVSGYIRSAGIFSFMWLFGFGTYATIQNNRELKIQKKQEEETRQVEKRKAELEHLVQARTTELRLQKEQLENTLAELRAAQAQLVHSEKMASLGELTAGIAHEIQNPLNFVNNFSELSVELAGELSEELDKPDPDPELIRELVQDLAQNQQKINHHGKRAANIVTGMLQHSRTSTGKKEPVDLNALADEYLRLSYHGLRAKDKSFNAKMVTELDPAVGKTDVIPQDLGRVLLNLINNAFYAVTQKKRDLEQQPGHQKEAAAYEPTVTVASRISRAGMVEIRIKDNGTGIPESLKAKIFQPFFTTKPTGQGTGLGLSLAFDIITKGHGGKLELKSTEGEGTEFIIKLPAQTETA